MSETINLGSVTAYASAVEGGYTGTYADFCEVEANFAEIAEDIDTALTNKADLVNGKVSSDQLPTLGTASALNVASSGNAGINEVVKGNDTRLTDARNAADVYSWAKESTKPTYTASEVGAIASTLKGVANGVAELDANGKVPSAQLPSFVDDVIEAYYDSTTDRFYEESTFETLITPVEGKSWVDIPANKSYRWTGSVYVRVDEGVQLGETSDTAYAGNKGKANADAISGILDGTSIDSFGDVETALSGKADKVSNATNGNFAGLDSNGNLTDSGKKPSDFLTKAVLDINPSASAISTYATGTMWIVTS